MSVVTIDNGRASVTFEQFDLEEYDLFLRCKALPERELEHDWRTDTYTITTAARYADRLGAATSVPTVDVQPLAPHLFDYQRWIVAQALDAKRYAIWADTGLGKTAMFLEWARQVRARTGGRVLILSPPQIIEQTRAEYRLFYGCDSIERLETREQLAAWCAADDGQEQDAIGICNYEKLSPGQMPELRRLAGLALDESSILKSGGGTIKWNLIHSAKGIEYKLSCTATPAPNDTMEYASQAAFLEKLRNEGEILWTYFSRDKYGTWSVKPHARDAFYRFMASWSIYLRNPAHYGFGDILATLPPPEIHEHRIEATAEQMDAMHAQLAESGRGLFDERLGVKERAKLSQIAKGFVYVKGEEPTRIRSRKPEVVGELVYREVRKGRPTIVWTIFDAESEIVEAAIGNYADKVGATVNVAVLHGSNSDGERTEAIRRFRAGEADVLVTKAQLVGYGLNFQNCRAMVFSGFDDSFERMYQAIRRAYRFGQTETVHVHVPVVPELEGLMLDNLKRKQAQFERDVDVQESHYRQALNDQLSGARETR